MITDQVSIYSGQSGGPLLPLTTKLAPEQKIYQLSVHTDSTETISTTQLPPRKYIPKVPRVRILLAPYMSPYEVPLNKVQTWESLHRTIRNIFGDNVFNDATPRITNKKGATITPEQWDSTLTPGLTIIVDTCAIIPEDSISIYDTNSQPKNKYNYTPARRRRTTSKRNEYRRPPGPVGKLESVAAMIMNSRDSLDSTLMDSPNSPYSASRISNTPMPMLRSRPMEAWEGWTSDSETGSIVVPVPAEPRARPARSNPAVTEYRESVAPHLHELDSKRSMELNRQASGVKRAMSKNGSVRRPSWKKSNPSLRSKRSKEGIKEWTDTERPPPVPKKSFENLRQGVQPVPPLRPKFSFEVPKHEEPPIPPFTQLGLKDSLEKLRNERSRDTTPFQSPTLHRPSSPLAQKITPQITQRSAPSPRSSRRSPTAASSRKKKKSTWSRITRALLLILVGRPDPIRPLPPPPPRQNPVQNIILNPSKQIPKHPTPPVSKRNSFFFSRPLSMGKKPILDVTIPATTAMFPYDGGKASKSGPLIGTNTVEITSARPSPRLQGNFNKSPHLNSQSQLQSPNIFNFPPRADSLPISSRALPSPSTVKSQDTTRRHSGGLFRSGSLTRRGSKNGHKPNSSVTSIISISPPIPKRGPELELGFNAQFRTPFVQREKIVELVQAEQFLEEGCNNRSGSRLGLRPEGRSAKEVYHHPERSTSQLSYHRPMITPTQPVVHTFSAFPPASAMTDYETPPSTANGLRPGTPPSPASSAYSSATYATVGTKLTARPVRVVGGKVY
ncbi:hypothetical protein EX30DRAFT_263777 [Ascodesmis nigricans]|uniref:Ubiquitin-like domain-containing protein n=1 Tax=Ascodesmis nigricans TaxID=341454 RepID=A0A4V3SIU1_9PEZI|nr:hypothetical protein EX30DRAFT_263777 [Ascodesmis nigricans]